MPQPNLDREKFMLARTIIGVVSAANAPYCCTDGDKQEAINADPNYVNDVAQMVAEEFDSKMMLESLMEILTEAHKRCVQP